MIYLIYILIYLCSIFKQDLLIYNFKNCDGTYFIYTNYNYEITNNNTYIMQNGGGNIYITNIKNYEDLLFEIPKLTSEKIVVKGCDFQTILKRLNASINEKIMVDNDIELYNCYSNRFKKYINSKMGKINIQIAISKDIISIGYPVLIDY